MTQTDFRARAVHLVDIENILGDPLASGETARSALQAFLRSASWRPGDLVSVAANPRIALSIAHSRPVECSIHCGRGKDAADRILVAHTPVDWLARRVQRLVIGSGDHFFLSLAREARARGLKVNVIGRAGSIHAGFWRVASTVEILDVSTPVRPAAA